MKKENEKNEESCSLAPLGEICSSCLIVADFDEHARPFYTIMRASQMVYELDKLYIGYLQRDVSEHETPLQRSNMAFFVTELKAFLLSVEPMAVEMEALLES